MIEEAVFSLSPVPSAPAKDVITQLQIALNNLMTSVRMAVSEIPEMAPPSATSEGSDHHHDKVSLQCTTREKLNEDIACRSNFIHASIAAIQELSNQLPDSTRDNGYYNREISRLEEANRAAEVRLARAYESVSRLDSLLRDTAGAIANDLVTQEVEASKLKRYQS